MVLDSIMENANEMSSSLSFASSSYLSNGSTNQPASPELCSNLDNLSLSRLSSNLEKLLLDAEYDFTDAEIIVEGKSVYVHCCILSARSHFFHELFKKGNEGSVSEGKPKFLMTELVPYGKVGYEAFNVILYYFYTGKLKPSPLEVSTCVDVDCAHEACPPAINYAIELMYASAAFQMKELVLLFQRRLLNFVEKALVEDVIPILVAAFHCQLNHLHSLCIQKVVRSNIDNVCLEKELPDEVSSEIRSLRVKSQKESEANAAAVDLMHEKRVRRIHKAMDSDDIELLNLLLDESNVSLDDAYALHYAAAYCNPKVFKEVLNMGLADLNLKDARGHTVLHVAARRKELAVLVTLLTKEACASETTSDGQTAVAICRRMTRLKDYNETTKQGQETNTDKLCIDVLEREMRRNSMSGNMIISSEVIADDFHMRLNYLENRVAFARLLFPTEARVAMDIADATDSALFHTGLAASKSKESSGNLKEVDLNETPSMQARRLQLRLQALLKTVETGRRYFPNCSEVVDKFLDCDRCDASLLEKGTPEEQKLKRARFLELKEEVQRAFSKDIAEKNRSGAEKNRSGLSSSSSSSTSPKGGVKYKARKR